jgi:hypothetical protein
MMLMMWSRIKLINFTPLVFYAASALWDSLPNIVLSKGTDYRRLVSFLERNVCESDTEGTRNKKNSTRISLSLWNDIENEKGR